MKVKTELAEEGNQPGGIEALSKVNEQKDNVLASNMTLSPSAALARSIMAGVQCMRVMIGDLVSLFSSKHI